jgi:hypothetical protein
MNIAWYINRLTDEYRWWYIHQLTDECTRGNRCFSQFCTSMLVLPMCRTVLTSNSFFPTPTRHALPLLNHPPLSTPVLDRRRLTRHRPAVWPTHRPDHRRPARRSPTPTRPSVQLSLVLRYYSVINILYCDIGYFVSIFCMVCV